MHEKNQPSRAIIFWRSPDHPKFFPPFGDRRIDFQEILPFDVMKFSNRNPTWHVENLDLHQPDPRDKHFSTSTTDPPRQTRLSPTVWKRNLVELEIKDFQKTHPKTKHLKIYLPSKIVISQCHLSLLEGHDLFSFPWNGVVNPWDWFGGMFKKFHA